MTPFWITLNEGVQFVISSFGLMKGGEIFVPKIPSVKIIDVAKAMSPSLKTRIVGIRSGEKLHELLFSKEESAKVLEHKNYYEILPSIKFYNLSNKTHAKEYVLNGGDDYELMFTVNKRCHGQFLKLARDKKFKVYKIGEINLHRKLQINYACIATKVLYGLESLSITLRDIYNDYEHLSTAL